MILILPIAFAHGPPWAPPFYVLQKQIERLPMESCSTEAFYAVRLRAEVLRDGHLRATVLEPTDLPASLRSCVQKQVATQVFEPDMGNPDPKVAAGTEAHVWIEIGSRPPFDPIRSPFASTPVWTCLDVRPPWVHERVEPWLEAHTQKGTPVGFYRLDETTWIRWEEQGWDPQQACVESLPAALLPLRMRTAELGGGWVHGPVTLHVSSAGTLREACRYVSDSTLPAAAVLKAHDLPAEVRALAPLPASPDGWTLRFWGPQLVALHPGAPAEGECLPLVP